MTNSTAVLLPDGSGASMLRWLIDLADLPALPADDQLAAHFGQALLGSLGGAAGLGDRLRPIVASLKGATVVAANSAAPHHISAVLLQASGDRLKVELIADPKSANLIQGAQFQPLVAGPDDLPWSEVSVLGATPGADWLGAAMNELREEIQQPALVAAILRDGEVVDFRAAGVLNVLTRSEPTLTTQFRIGSVSKLFTAVGVMQLVEQGLVGLDDAVNDHLTSFSIKGGPETGAPVTLRHLLTHTSGLAQPVAPVGLPDGEPIPTIAEAFGVGSILGLCREPGLEFEYSNTGFCVIGQLIADVTGLSFEDYMVAKVFDVLGMRHTDFVRTERVEGEIPSPYTSDFDVVSPVEYLDVVVRAAGSVYAPAPDMARFADAMLNGGANNFGRVLAPDTVATMLTPHFKDDVIELGLCFILTEHDGVKMAWHNGGWPGANTEFWLAPEHGVGVLLAANVMSLSKVGKFDAAAAKILAYVATT